MSNTESLELAGVPVVVRPPGNPSLPAPLIILWHEFGVPNSEEMLVDVLPLEGVQAWKAYLGLPLFGKRLPPGGREEIMRRQISDYVLQLVLPVVEQAMQELPSVVQALQAQYTINDTAGIGLFGFSAGGIAALLTLVESSLKITTSVFAGVTKNLGSAVDTYERTTKQYYPMLKEQFSWINEDHIPYHWTEASVAAKHRLDFVARAAAIAQRQPMPAVLFVHGLQDEAYAVSDVEELQGALAPYYEQAHQSKLLSLRTFSHLGHQLDLVAAQNLPELQQDLADLNHIVTTWFSQYLLN